MADSLIATILIETVRLLYLAAPYLLLGLVMAGFVHVLLPSRVVERWLGRPGLGGAARAAAIGVPLPVCSCGVVPLAIEMRRKKASEPASLSFLVTTPESGVDSVLFTWGLMGPVMAIARPVAAFGTAMLGAVGATLFPTPADALPVDDDTEAASCCATTEDPAPAEASCCATDHDHDHEHSHGHEHGHEHHHDEAEAPSGALGTVRSAFGYGFGQLFDDIAFWLVLGVALGGVLTALVPSDLSALGLGDGFLPMLLMLAVGVPLYMCASASTPVAAALLAKGLSPGAALVFLLAGPATNAAALVVLARAFGKRFVGLYVGSVAIGALLAGLAFDAVLGLTGWTVTLPMLHDHGDHLGPIGVASFVLLVALLIRAGWRGAMADGWNELAGGFRALIPFRA
ncbi:MAG: SO_0444 family Cu/Zn efflux transporter [Acidobacteriota bacterium]